MFTGLVECIGVITHIETKGNNKTFIIRQPELSSQLSIDESVAHNGVCLTVEAIFDDQYQVTAIQETLDKTTAAQWHVGQELNLERAIMLSDRLGGHLVQGHVDGTGTCVARQENEGSVDYRFRFQEKFAPLVIEKGSITIDGISLTCFNVTENEFSVSIIPYTFEHTIIKHVQPGTSVNLEFDLVGKYIQRNISLAK